MKKITLLIALALIFLLPTIFASCGDNVCDTGENRCTCPTDCGICKGEVFNEICRYFTCEENRCMIKVQPNCCGNNTCELNENYGICPADCEPKEISMELLSPDPKETFYRGDKILFKIELTSHGREAILSNAKLIIDENKVSFYNDGKHDDEIIFDKYFGTYFEIPTDWNGRKNFVIDVNFLNVRKKFPITLNVTPKLNVEIETKNSYLLGETINAKIKISKKELHKMPINIKILNSNEKEVYKEFFPNKNTIKTEYKLSSIDSPGNWKIIILGLDDKNNLAKTTKTIKVLDPNKTQFLSIEKNNIIKEKYIRGENLDLSFIVKESDGMLPDANVFGFSPSLGQINFDFNDSGKNYFTSIIIPYNISKKEKITITATKNIDKVEYKGTSNLEISVEPTNLKVTILSPTQTFSRVGERIPTRIKIQYPDGSLVTGANLTAKIISKELTFKPASPGIYETNIFFEMEDSGKQIIRIFAKDQFENSGNATLTFEISGVDPIFQAQSLLFRYWYIFVALSIFGIFSYSYYNKKIKIKQIEKEEEKYIELETKIQQDYFEKNILSKEEYEKLFLKYENKLHSIKRQKERFL